MRALLLFLILSFVTPPVPAQAGAFETGNRVQPALATMAHDQPEAMIRVIIQKADGNGDLDRLLARLDGRVIKSLGMINAVVAELPAGRVPEVAQSAAVRWISLDAKTLSSTTQAQDLPNGPPADVTDEETLYLPFVQSSAPDPSELQGRNIDAQLGNILAQESMAQESDVSAAGASYTSLLHAVDDTYLYRGWANRNFGHCSYLGVDGDDDEAARAIDSLRSRRHTRRRDRYRRLACLDIALGGNHGPSRCQRPSSHGRMGRGRRVRRSRYAQLDRTRTRRGLEHTRRRLRSRPHRDRATLAATGTYAWRIDALVNGWRNGAYPNHGLALTQPLSNGGTWKDLRSRESSYSYPPRLYVRYSFEPTIQAEISTTPAGEVIAGDLVTVNMHVVASEEMSDVSPSVLAVEGSSGVGAELVSGPTPAKTAVGPGGVTFAWVYRVATGGDTGEVTFTAAAGNGTLTSPTTKSSPVTVVPSAPPEILPGRFVLKPSKDTYISELSDDINFGACAALQIDKRKDKPTHSLLRFDLAALPLNTKINSAKLVLTKVGGSNDLQTVDLHQVTAPWTEGAGSCSNNQTNSEYANWKKRQPDLSWNDDGGDFHPSTTAAADVSANGLYEWDVTTLVQGWVSGSPNYGFLLKARNETDGSALQVFASRNEQATDLQPQLIIESEPAAGEPVFVTWASSLGTVSAMEYTDPANMVDDDALGPDGLYGRGSDVKGSFGGFEAEVTPGYAIGKVEVVLHGYITQASKEDIKFKIYVDGHKVGEEQARGDIFVDTIGQENAGRVYVDITSAHEWRWGDVNNDLQLMIEQHQHDDEFVFLDAVGLRITSVPGIDLSDKIAPNALPKEAINYANLQSVHNLSIRAHEVWNEAPKFLQGDGVTVAIVDSGIGKSEDLKKRNLYNVNFNRGHHETKDKYGHGSFVASVLAANGKKSDGERIGIAPRSTYSTYVSAMTKVCPMSRMSSKRCNGC